MTVQEIQTMIRQNMVLYRNVAKPLTDKEADLLIATWADALSDVPSAAGKLAFRRASDIPPSLRRAPADHSRYCITE